MTSKSVPPVQPSEVPGIDLLFRPKSYFWPLSLETHLLARIKGAERKATLLQHIETRGLDAIPALLAQSALSHEDRRTLGRIHPAFMGGEYLPNLALNEMIIARITIASTTQDVTCVYARRCRHRIHYRVVDEYGGGTLSSKTTRTSSRPLTLGELETFFNGAWSIFDVLDFNFGREGFDLRRMLRFVVDVSSQFYPQIGELYERRIEAWAALRQSEQGLDRTEKGPGPVVKVCAYPKARPYFGPR